MMSENFRKVVFLFVLLGVALVICSGLVYLLAGDKITDVARDFILNLQLNNRRTELNTPISTTDDTVIRFTVTPGSNAQTIGERLENLNIITDGGLFALYARVEGLDVELEAGTFFIRRNMSIQAIVHELTNATFSQIEFTIFPGERIEQIAERIDTLQPYFAFTGADFLALVGKNANLPAVFAENNNIPLGSSLEGFLFPDTYIFDPEVTAVEMRDVLLAAFNNAITPDLRASIAQTPYTIYEIVTLASIIERETVHNDEKPTVSSVYRNRLERPAQGISTLDADPTVQYEHPDAGAGNWWPPLTVSDYRGVNSRYNTYLYSGLPPAPIANPALSSITAAIFPEQTDYYFFRADCRNDFRHDFFTNYTDHVNRC
jgi:UPF0755 protein